MAIYNLHKPFAEVFVDKCPYFNVEPTVLYVNLVFN